VSIDFYFYVETVATGVWTRPDACAHLERAAALGEFTWLPRRAAGAALFFGKTARFPFRSGRPPHTEASALFAYIDRGLDWDELDPRWVSFEELLVDSWDEPTLLVEARVPVTLAALFEDGEREFPEAALLARGCAEPMMHGLRQGTLASQAIDRTFGKARHEVETAPTSAPLSVTWRDSVSKLLGADRAASFRNLRRYGKDAELRVIALLG
jgi:hypothetical protein